MSESPVIRVLMVNGSRLMSEAVATSLGGHDRIRLVATATSAADAVRRLREDPVDVALVEASQSRPGALQTTRRLRDAAPELEIVPVGVRHVRDVVRFAEAGANAYVMQQASLAELVSTIESVHGKLTPCSPEIAARLFARINELSRQSNGSRVKAAPVLTPRELEVLGRIAAGLRNKEIAQSLEITLSTVKNHVHNILDKIQVRNRREAISWANEHGLLAGDDGAAT